MREFGNRRIKYGININCGFIKARDWIFLAIPYNKSRKECARANVRKIQYEQEGEGERK